MKKDTEALKISCCATGRYCMFDDLKTFVYEIEEEMKNGVSTPPRGRYGKESDAYRRYTWPSGFFKAYGADGVG